MGLAVLVGAAELLGLLARLRCQAGSCSSSEAAWALRWDMDALGSVPRLLMTGVFVAVAVAALVGVARCARAGARPWWLVLGASGIVLALAKAFSVHSLLEVGLMDLLGPVDVLLFFLVVSVIGLTVVLVSGTRVRRDTRAAVVTWLSLYAVAAVGLAAGTNAVSHLGPVPLAWATWLEETAEALTAVGLLAVVLAGVRDLSARRG